MRPICALARIVPTVAVVRAALTEAPVSQPAPSPLGHDRVGLGKQLKQQGK
ncbi:MAG: hypothetical protein ACREFK_15345 [Stellaceae bacterium]